MLDSSLDDVKDRYEKAKPQLENLKSKRDQIVTRLNLRIEQSRHEFQRAVNKNTLAIADMIPGWISSYKPKASFSAIHPKDSAKRIAMEISEYVTTKIQEQQKKWKDEVMLPLAQEKAQYIFDSADQDLTKLYSELDTLTIQISGSQKIEANNVPIWQRIAGAGAGVLLGMPDVAIAGGMNGLSKDLLKNLGIVLGTEALLIFIVGALNPLVLIGGMLAGLLGGGVLNANSAVNKIKEKLTQSYVAAICEKAEDNSYELASKICKQLSAISNDISAAVETEINNVEQQVNGIIKEMEKGKANIDARKKVLDSCEAKLKSISSDLDTFTFELIEQK